MSSRYPPQRNRPVQTLRPLPVFGPGTPVPVPTETGTFTVAGEPDSVEQMSYMEPAHEPVEIVSHVVRNDKILQTVRIIEQDVDAFEIYTDDEKPLVVTATEEEARAIAEWFLEGFSRGYDQRAAESAHRRSKKSKIEP